MGRIGSTHGVTKPASSVRTRRPLLRVAAIALCSVVLACDSGSGFGLEAPVVAEPELLLRGPDPQSVTLLVFGDSGTGSAVQAAVARGMREVCARLACDGGLVTGDLFYDDGVPLQPDDPRLATRLHVPYAPLANEPSFRLYAVAGNHDVEAGLESELAFLQSSPLWSMPSLDYAVPGLPPWLRIYGVFTTPPYKGVDPTAEVLRSLGAARPTAADSAHRFGAQWARARAYLCDGPADAWRISFGHHPLASHAQGPSERLASAMISLFEACDVQLYLAGHAHQQEVRRIGDLVQIIEGAAGAPRAVGGFARLGGAAFLSDRAGFAVVRFWRERMVAVLYDQGGEPLFTLSLANALTPLNKIASPSTLSPPNPG